MLRLGLILLFLITVLACQSVQTQSNAIENKDNGNKNTLNNQNNSEHYGYARFTKSDKTYLGCWKSIKASEVVNYQLKYFQFTEKAIQTSKTPKNIMYVEEEANSYKDYFVLKTESKKGDLQPYLSINIVSDDEMTVHEFGTKKDITDGEGVNYWDFKERKLCNSFRKIKEII